MQLHASGKQTLMKWQELSQKANLEILLETNMVEICLYGNKFETNIMKSASRGLAVRLKSPTVP